MTAFLAELARLAALAALAFFCVYGWASFWESVAGSDCLCRRHAWHPACPVHGRREPA